MYFFANETKLFKLFHVPSTGLSSAGTGPRAQQRWFDGNDVDAAAASVPGLSASLFFFSLLINECFPKAGRRFRGDVAYRRLYFYHRLAHGPAYTRNTDNRLVEPHCSMLHVLRVFVTNEKFSQSLIHSYERFFKFLHKR